jgi:hypothetical protein
MLKIQQRKNSDRWSDYAAAGNIDEAKQIIQEAVEKSDITDYRVIEVKLTCKQEIVFIEPEDPEPEQEESEPGKLSEKEEKMLLDFLRKTIELRRFPKTKELDNDEDMHDYIRYYNTFGSKSNICDIVISKITADKIDPDFKNMIEIYCENCEDDISECCDKNPANCLLEEIKTGDNNEKN